MDYTKEQLTEARRQIRSTLHKLRQADATLRAKADPGRVRSQLTLVQRRIEAFSLADDLIGQALARPAAPCVPKTLYLVGGAMGVGKTTVCKQLNALLPQSVFLDGDWCWDASPFQVTPETQAMVLDNICHTLANFLGCSAYRNVVFCWVMHRQDIIDAILSRLPLAGCRVCCVSLTASEAVLRRRLEADVLAGLRSPDVIQRSLARLPLYDGLHTVKVLSDGKAPADLAAEIARLTAARLAAD